MPAKAGICGRSQAGSKLPVIPASTGRLRNVLKLFWSVQLLDACLRRHDEKTIFSGY
jgi:hypothetical protein